MVNHEFILFCALGALLGSFLNVFISRGPRAWGLVDREELPSSLYWPPSTCESCGRRIKPWELIPILSYIVLKGKCSACGANIGFRHVFVELMGGSIAVIAAVRFGITGEAGAAALLLYALLALAVIDSETGFLPDAVTIPLIFLGLLAAQFLGGSFLPAAIGATIGGGGLYLLAGTYRTVRKREGLGGGDVKLMTALGAWLGPMNLPWVLLIASISGLAFAGLAMLQGSRAATWQAEVRFGPFLAVGAAATLFFGFPAPFS